MIPQLKPVEQKGRQAQPQRYGRLKEQRHADYAPSFIAIDAMASQEARRIIRASKLEDTKAQWGALKRAYLRGYAEGQR